jgi:hypothetical protein
MSAYDEVSIDDKYDIAVALITTPSFIFIHQQSNDSKWKCIEQF